MFLGVFVKIYKKVWMYLPVMLPDNKPMMIIIINVSTAGAQAFHMDYT
jgi:hypothetical protein